MHQISRSIAVAIALAALAGRAQAAGVSVGIDMTQPVHLSRDAASVMVGNPAIADVYIQNGKLIFLQGRSFGTTNLIALDSAGKEIVDVPVTVTASRGKTVTLQRGIDGRISYACAGRCEQELMPGDDPDHVKTMLEEVSGKTGAADQVATSNARAGSAPPD